MNVLLILPKINSQAQWNVGLAYISAVLKENGHGVELFEVRDYQKDISRILSAINQYRPRIVGISANSHQFRYAKEMAGDIKKKFQPLILVGGVHTILKSQAIEEEKSIDGVYDDEGEMAILEMAERMQRGTAYLDVKNFWFRSGEKIIKNNLRPLVEDLDSLPAPDRSIFYYFSGGDKNTPRFIFSRGCPFECTFCCNHAFKRNYQGLGQYVRWRSVDSALAEIEKEKRQYNFNYFKLDDDTFSLNRPWLKEFCEKIAQKKWGLAFECNVRPGTIDEESMKALKKASCQMVKIGIESGNPKLRKEVLNRHFSNDDIVKTFDLAKKYGIKIYSFNIIGVPGETPETIRDAVNLNHQIRPDFMQVTSFYPYPGTTLGDLCFAKGYVDKDYEDSYFEKSVLKLPTISRDQIEKAVRDFKFNVYWAYDKKRALGEKWLQIKKAIISRPKLYRLAKIAYAPVKIIKTVLFRRGKVL